MTPTLTAYKCETMLLHALPYHLDMPFMALLNANYHFQLRSTGLLDSCGEAQAAAGHKMKDLGQSLLQSKFEARQVTSDEAKMKVRV